MVTGSEDPSGSLVTVFSKEELATVCPTIGCGTWARSARCEKWPGWG